MPGTGCGRGIRGGWGRGRRGFSDGYERIPVTDNQRVIFCTVATMEDPFNAYEKRSDWVSFSVSWQISR